MGQARITTALFSFRLTMTIQLTLNLHLRDDASFHNFYSQRNELVVAHLQQIFNSDQISSPVYLWGNTGVGRSHLLQASCQLATEKGLAVGYIPLQHWRSLSSDMLEGLESLNLICIDDIDAVATQPAWEEALFHLYNRCLTTGAILIVAANCPPAQLLIQLSDLTSRLAASVIFHMQALRDEEKLFALQLHANTRGLELSSEIGEYLLRHCSRDMKNLCQVLDRLDLASLAAQRKLTIPFVKEVLMIS
jgi:DnaA-homolog protein